MVVAGLVATILGFLSGLGTGGGSLLILWLTLALEWPPLEARVMNLMFFIPSALIACIFRRKQGNLPLKKIYPGILAGCLFALVFSLLSKVIDSEGLKKLFGGLLILTGLRELFYRERNAR